MGLYPDIVQFLHDIAADLAAEAFAGTSQAPEKEGARARCDYAIALIGDKDHITRAVQYAIARRVAPAENWEQRVETWFQEHRHGLKTVWENYLEAHAVRLFVGPGKLSVGQKTACEWVDLRLAEIVQFRMQSRQKVLQELLPQSSAEAESDPRTTAESLLAKLEGLEMLRDRMEATNTILGQLNVDENEKVSEDRIEKVVKQIMEATGWSKSYVLTILQPDSMGHVGFRGCDLASVKASIARLLARLSEHAHDALVISDVFGQVCTVISEDAQICISFLCTPPDELTHLLRSNAFSWSSARSAWVRKLSPHAISTYQAVVRPELMKWAGFSG